MKEKLKAMAEAPGNVVPALKSKKFVGAGGFLAALLTVANMEMGEKVKLTAMIAVAVIAAAYLVSQGIADFGKEKAKVEKE